MNSITPTDLHWLAGLLEGEGSFDIQAQKPNPVYRKPREYRYARVQITSTDRDVLERVKQIIGAGSLIPYKAKGKNREHHKMTYRYALSGEKAIDLMAEIAPLMCSRRQERIGAILDEVI